ncbi:MAG: hypothetical protein KIS67_10825 [Verrucomicrobiae bacterium]|nr:hypothetical protein [Verrucomicrobiae bacterium]
MVRNRIRRLLNCPRLCYTWPVALNAKSRRRLFGALCLLAAIVMLVAESTFLKHRLGDVALLVYWLVCFGFTFLAMGAAFLDALVLRHEARQQQRALFESTLRKIEEEKAHKKPDPQDGQHSSL